MNKKIEVLNQ